MNLQFNQFLVQKHWPLAWQDAPWGSSNRSKSFSATLAENRGNPSSFPRSFCYKRARVLFLGISSKMRRRRERDEKGTRKRGICLSEPPKERGALTAASVRGGRERNCEEETEGRQWNWAHLRRRARLDRMRYQIGSQSNKNNIKSCNAIVQTRCSRL